MNILVIGNGAREHCIIWKLKQNNKVEQIFCTIGNAGIRKIAKVISIKQEDIDALTNFAMENEIDLTVVGPEIPLSLGIVDEFSKNGLKIFGPSGNAARLETSKAFAKDFMKRHSIPTSDYRKFSSDEIIQTVEYLSKIKYPVVIKADGLAAGKGVIISEDFESAKKTITEIFDQRVFGKAGDVIVIEEFLSGKEASVFAVSDGKDYVILPPAQDHKKIFDGERGKNTGGMGSFAPAEKIVNEKILNKIKTRIIEPVLKNMKDEENEYKGCLYCGLMIDNNGDPFVIEFNARFGDPETQVVLPLIESDFLELLERSVNGTINNYKLKTEKEYYCSVVLASKGYPDKYETGKVIEGLNNVEPDCLIFHAGTTLDLNGQVLTSGGRVLNVIGKSSSSLPKAIEAAYRNVDRINYSNKYFRTDIGKKGLN
jgi:phosphoribosylamine--glycine ligase